MATSSKQPNVNYKGYILRVDSKMFIDERWINPSYRKMHVGLERVKNLFIGWNQILRDFACTATETRYLRSGIDSSFARFVTHATYDPNLLYQICSFVGGSKLVHVQQVKSLPVTRYLSTEGRMITVLEIRIPVDVYNLIGPAHLRHLTFSYLSDTAGTNPILSCRSDTNERLDDCYLP